MSLNNNTDRTINNYNRQIKKLLTVVCASAKRNNNLEDIRDRVKIAIDVDPAVVIENTKDYILEYKTYFENDKFDEMLSDDVLNLNKYNVENKVFIELFSTLKKQYINYTQDEKSIIHGILKNLLKFAVEYSS